MTNKKETSNTQIAKLDNFNSIEEMTLWANTIIDAGFLPDNITQPEEVISIVQHGKELGLSPHIALNNIHIIQGRPTLSSSMIGALLKRKGIEWVWDCDFDVIKDATGNPQKTPKGATNRKTTIHFFWKAVKLDGRIMDTTHSVTWLQMEMSGYTEKSNWQKYPKEMMRARCMAYGCRALFPEVLSGIYTDLELVDSLGSDTDVDVTLNEEGDLNLKFNTIE